MKLRETIKCGDRIYEVGYHDVDGTGFKLIAVAYTVAKVTPTTVAIKTLRYGTVPARQGLTSRVSRKVLGGRYLASEREAWLAYIEREKREIEARQSEITRRQASLEAAYLELGKVVTGG